MTDLAWVILSALILFVAYALGMPGWVIVLLIAAFGAGFVYGGGAWTM